MMANTPEKSPGAGLWEYGQRIARHVTQVTWRLFRAIARNRSVLMAVISIARAIVKLIAAIYELCRHF